MTGWIDVVAEEAESRWAHQKPLFLAQIPPLLRRHAIDLEDVLRGRSLMLAIASDATSSVRLVKDPDHELVWAVIPHRVPDDFDLREIFHKTQEIKAPVSRAPAAVPLFQRWFFTAFIKALAPGHKRYVLLDHFRDLPESEIPPPGAWEVQSTEILNPEPDAIVDREDIFDRIKRWTERYGVAIDQFCQEPKSAILERRESSGPKSLIAFDTLEIDELRRIMVPMDVVLKLLRR